MQPFKGLAILNICETDTLTSSKLLSTPVGEWLKPLIFSALIRSSSHHRGFQPHMWDKTSSACECSVFFLGDLPLSPHLTIDSAQSEWNNLDGP